MKKKLLIVAMLLTPFITFGAPGDIVHVTAKIYRITVTENEYTTIYLNSITDGVLPNDCGGTSMSLGKINTEVKKTLLSVALTARTIRANIRIGVRVNDASQCEAYYLSMH